MMKIEKRKKEKMARKAEQEKNVKRKEDEKAEHKQKSMEGIFKKAMKDKKPEDLPPQFQGEVGAESGDSGNEEYEEEDNDEEYYRQEGMKGGGMKRKSDTQLDS